MRKEGTREMTQAVRVAGIDVGKARLDVARPAPPGPVRRLTVANDAAGHEALLAWCLGHGVAVVAVEASGGYERAVVARLRAAGLVVRRLNPLRVRRFAEARGRLAKNDRADAEGRPGERDAPRPDRSERRFRTVIPTSSLRVRPV